jgi:large exoprotein involved in heme utilization and adhesion
LPAIVLWKQPILLRPRPTCRDLLISSAGAGFPVATGSPSLPTQTVTSVATLVVTMADGGVFTSTEIISTTTTTSTKTTFSSSKAFCIAAGGVEEEKQILEASLITLELYPLLALTTQQRKLQLGPALESLSQLRYYAPLSYCSYK